MKMVIGFAMGMVLSLSLVLAISYFSFEAKAEENPPSPSDVSDFSSLIPDVGKIYRQAFGGPYRQVETEIHDRDIANYYHKLMDQTGLNKIGAE